MVSHLASGGEDVQACVKLPSGAEMDASVTDSFVKHVQSLGYGYGPKGSALKIGGILQSILIPRV